MLHIQGVSKQFGSKVLFEDADAHIGHRSRMALIGPNGAGKSTLIKLIIGDSGPEGAKGMEHADRGEISRAKGLTIGYLAQEAPKYSGRTVLEETMRMDGRREGLLKLKADLEEGFTRGDHSEANLERYGRVLEELEHLDEYRIESRAKAILDGMGFKASDYTRSLTEFSGGWLMRVALARVLLMDPDLLLLDEPTNHLDLESLLWLEEFLRGFQGALLLVSHDTAFLNRMVTTVVEIDQRKLFTYSGNLDAWRTQKEERLTLLRSQAAGQSARIAELQSFVDRFGAKATKARQAQSRMKQIEKLEANLVELPEDRSTVRFRFPPAPHSGREVITMRKAAMRFGTKTVFKDLDWVIQRGSRVAIVGVNGAGKTTLLRLIGGQLDATEGMVKYGHEVKIGYYAQHQAETLDFSKTILQELEQTAPEMGIARIRAIAGAFLFSGDAVEKKCGVLSGGEKARVALAKLLLSPSNFLVLDEPTNHLDIESRGVLLQALQDYEGTLCLVSHDRDFVTPLVDTVLEIDPAPEGSRAIPLVGSYDDYIARKIAETRLQAQAKLSGAEKNSPGKAASADAEPTAQSRTTPSNNQKRSWEREREKLEAEISKLDRRQAEINEAMGDVTTYSDKAKSMALAEEQRKLAKDLETKMSRWEEVCSLLGV